MVFLEGSYAAVSNVSLTQTEELNVAFRGAVESLKLTVSSPSISLFGFTSFAGLKSSSVVVSLMSNASIAVSNLVLNNTGFSVDPIGLTLYNTTWAVAYCQFYESDGAPTAIFDFALPAGSLNPTTVHNFYLSDSSASLYRNDGTGRSPYFIQSQAYIDSIYVLDSQIDGAATFAYFIDFGFAQNMEVTRSTFTELGTNLVYAVRFAGSPDAIARDVLSTTTLADRSLTAGTLSSAAISPPLSYIWLKVNYSSITGRTFSATTALPRISINAVRLLSENSIFTGVSINCRSDGTPVILPQSGDFKISNTTLHNCGACFDRNVLTFTNTRFTYARNDSSLVFTSFSSTSANTTMVNVSFIDSVVNKDQPRLLFLNTFNYINGYNITTNSMLVAVNGTLRIHGVTFTGIVTLGANTEIANFYNSPNIGNRPWTFQAPLYFTFGGATTGNAKVSLGDVSMLEMQLSSDYVRDPGVDTIFKADKVISVGFYQDNMIFSKIHINWDSYRYDLPLSNVPYFIGPFTFGSLLPNNSMAGSLPKANGDEFAFDEVLQLTDSNRLIYTSYFTLDQSSPIYVPTAQWPATPFGTPYSIPITPPTSGAPRIPPATTVPTPPSSDCNSPAPTVTTSPVGSWSCSRNVWTYSGSISVASSTDLVFGRGDSSIRIQGDLVIAYASEVRFNDVRTRLVIEGCVTGLRTITYELHSIPENGFTELAVSQLPSSPCSSSRRSMNSDDVGINVLSPSGCTKAWASKLTSKDNELTVQFHVSKKKCHLIGGIVGGVLAAVVIAGIVIGVVLYKRRSARDPAAFPLIQH